MSSLAWRVRRRYKLLDMASQPTRNDGEETLEELDLEDAAVISHQSEVHRPARREAVQVDEPSIVVAPEPAPRESGARHATTRRGRRALEPTLLIRDRRQADELRLEMERRVRAIKRERLRSTLTWLVFGVVAFGLGGLVAVLVAKRTASEGPAPRIERALPERPPLGERASSVPAAQQPVTIDLDAVDSAAR